MPPPSPPALYVLFASAAFGCFIFNILSRVRGRVPALSLFLALKMKLDRPSVIFGDIVISCILGAIVALILFRPDSVTDALHTGLIVIAVLTAFGHDG
jgi:hypothetical protein